MKRILLLIICIANFAGAYCQIPYFSGTVGKNHLYGYTSFKFRPGENSQETYTTFQYGTTQHTAAGLDLYTSGSSTYAGVLIRAGYKFNQWIGVGGQVTPSFDLGSNCKLSYVTAALYLNGSITRNGRLFWCSNTWWGINNGSSNTINNWEYLGYYIPTTQKQSITPMVGMIHSWKFDQDVDIAAGAYYNISNWNFYLWGNDFLKRHPRVVIGVDFTY